MLTVIIVEDEYRICRMLKKIIESANIGYEVAKLCTDGISGVKAIEELHPDVVITDIKMAGCSGIELIEKSVQTNPNIDFIIISGYKYFENAYRAIQLGIKYYLLKPIDEDEIIRILNTIKTARSTEASQTRHHEEIENQITLQQAYLRDNLIFELYHKKFGGQISLELINERFCCCFKKGCFLLLLIKIDSFESKKIQEMNLLFQKIITIIEKNFTIYTHDILCSIQNEFLVCVMNYEYQEKNNIKKGFGSFFDDAKAQIRNFGPYMITVGVGMEKKTLTDLPEALNEARRAMRNRIVNGPMKIIWYETLPTYYSNVPGLISQTSKNQLLNVIRSGNIEKIDEWIRLGNEFFNKAIRIDVECLFELCIYISKMVTAFIWENLDVDVRNITDEFEIQLDMSGSPAEMISILKEHLLDLMDLYTKHLGKNEPVIIQSVKEYIHTNYAASIKLEDVAQTVHLSPTYLSGLFKQTAGVTFIEYLTQIRMDAAKRMLRSTKMSIAEIAAACGYTDDKYFAQLFRKHVGLRPAAYRKLYL